MWDIQILALAWAGMYPLSASVSSPLNLFLSLPHTNDQNELGLN